MSASTIISSITRHYLEGLGFFVRATEVSDAKAATKKPFAIELLSKEVATPDTIDKFYLFATDLEKVAQAILFTNAWQLPSNNSTLFKTSTKIHSFIEKNMLRKKEVAQQLRTIQSLFPEKTFILLLPTFPTNESHLRSIETSLRECGVTAVLSFRSIIREACSQSNLAEGKAWADTLQILQTYDLLRSDQLELFS